MGDSQSQFQELLAHLVARADKILSSQSDIFPLALLLLDDGRVETSIAAYESVDQVPALLNAMQEAAATKALETSVVASCIAYPDYDSGLVIAFLENRDNYCSKIAIPVATEPTLHLDTASMTVADGDVYVFPVAAS